MAEFTTLPTTRRKSWSFKFPGQGISRSTNTRSWKNGWKFPGVLKSTTTEHQGVGGGVTWQKGWKPEGTLKKGGQKWGVSESLKNMSNGAMQGYKRNTKKTTMDTV
jgi:hypothetical protein